MVQVSDFGPRNVAVTLQIANGQSLSGSIDLFGCNLVAILIDPNGWTTASLTFQVSPDDLTFAELWKSTGANDGAVYEVSSAAAVAGQLVTLPEDDFAGFRFLKVRSGTVGSPVVQGATRTLTLIVRPVD